MKRRWRRRRRKKFTLFDFSISRLSLLVEREAEEEGEVPSYSVSFIATTTTWSTPRHTQVRESERRNERRRKSKREERRRRRHYRSIDRSQPQHLNSHPLPPLQVRAAAASPGAAAAEEEAEEDLQQKMPPRTTDSSPLRPSARC